MDVQLPAQPVDQSGFSEQRPLETQDGCPTGQGKEEASSWIHASAPGCVVTPPWMSL